MLVRSQQESAEERGSGGAEVVHYTRILAPLDGSQRAEVALPLASALAERHSADLLVVHVVSRPELIQRVPLSPEDVALVERVVQRNMTEANKYFAQMQSRLPPQAQTRVLIDDSVARSLHQIVQQEQVDLVVLSAHGHSCHSELPYSALVNHFISYGTTSLFIIQDLPSSESKRIIAEGAPESLTMPTRRANEDEGLNIRGQFDI